MGIGHQYHLTATVMQGIQKWQRIVTYSNEVFNFALGSHNIHIQMLSPVVQAIPLNAATNPRIVLMHFFAALCQRTATFLGQLFRQVLQPELIIEVQVQ